MSWKDLLLQLAFGIAFFVLGIVSMYFLYGRREDASIYKFGKTILLLTMVLWCIFVILSEYFNIPFYFVVVFIPVAGVIIFLCFALVSRQKEGKYSKIDCTSLVDFLGILV